ncbi:ester cyclase [Kosakonia radicincitans DSM 16656]|uniref:ester cyclase n=1 Tax=Kosakonia radicincitans TaxID=283686 RepID=UPI000272D733|nr:ester cyclase [Kosakonia radicincitans]ARD59336.1 ester cyclase [Kosakonia radicincitans DSM 16656]KDE35711.1 ester cyclase [Kosakonia radicincitans UMEnt01/12]
MSDHNEIANRLAREREAVEKIYQAFSLQNPDLLDEAVTPDWQDIPLAPGQAAGPQGLKPIIRSFIAAFPDVQIVIQDLMQLPGKIAVRAEITGTHQGTFMGMEATGKFVRIRLHEMHELNGERVIKTWHMEDWLGLFMQLGKTPSLP